MATSHVRLLCQAAFFFQRAVSHLILVTIIRLASGNSSHTRLPKGRRSFSLFGNGAVFRAAFICGLPSVRLGCTTVYRARTLCGRLSTCNVTCLISPTVRVRRSSGSFGASAIVLFSLAKGVLRLNISRFTMR